MSRIYILGAALCFVLCSSLPLTANTGIPDIVWQDVSRDIADSNLQMVVISPDNADVVYVGSFKAVYRSTEGGKKWTEVFSLRGTGNTVNAIAITPSNTEIIYAGTDDGLYRSKNRGMQWEKVFSGIGDAERAVLFAAVNPQDEHVLYIGTRTGIFMTKNNGKDWDRGRGVPSDEMVYCIAIDNSNADIIYAASKRGLYKSADSGTGWTKILGTNFTAWDIGDSGAREEVKPGEIDDIEIENKIPSIAIDPSDPRVVYVGTAEGLFITRDAGLSWDRISGLGLGSRMIRHVLIDPKNGDRIYAATDRGVFRYTAKTESWDELYKGIATLHIRYLASAPSGRDGVATLWAATKKGVYKSLDPVQALPLDAAEESTALQNRLHDTQDAFSLFAHEPSIEDIRKAAIVYAEVQPEKIQKWRKAAAHRAWLPDLRFAYDRYKDWQSSDYFYSTSKEKYENDDITRGHDKGWSISLTWELGDLIWNSAQTSIDTRSRLMVQLRDDVLTEVTRLYYERRRFQFEMLMSPPADVNDRIEKELRLQELTAGIDALTGSYLSKRLGQTGTRSQVSGVSK